MSSHNNTRAALEFHRLALHGILGGVKFWIQQLAAARVLVQFVADSPDRTAMFDINMRRDQHFPTCCFVGFAGSVNNEQELQAQTSKFPAENACSLVFIAHQHRIVTKGLSRRY